MRVKGPYRHAVAPVSTPMGSEFDEYPNIVNFSAPPISVMIPN
jgi:hypothetical protein